VELNHIVPWGRSFAEYKAMFQLSDADLQKTILGCGDGPAAFNYQLNKLGGTVQSVDPIYQFSRLELQHRIDAIYDDVLTQVAAHKNNFVWDTIKSVTELGQIRIQAMNDFLADYDSGKQQGRYITGSLPVLEFSDQQFDLVLCSHFLFLYSDHFSLQQHIDSIVELCRVGKQVRIYPLLSLDNQLSPHLEQVRQTLKQQHLHTELQTVDYQFQQGANQMLVISSEKVN